MQSSTRIALWLCLAARLAGQSPAPSDLRVSLPPTARAANSSDDRIELRLSRPLAAGERMALIAGDTDVSAFLVSGPQKVTLSPVAVLLPPGEAQLQAWLVTAAHEWRDAGSVKVKVKKQTAGAAEGMGQQLPRLFTFQQSSSLQFRSQPLYKTSSRLTYRRTFEELNLQSSLIGKLQGQGWHADLQTNISGSTEERETLRYFQLGGAAPPVDLASYSIALETKRVKAWIGDQSFGTSRELISNFNARGVRVATNFGGRFDLTVGLTSGGPVEGFSNLLGFEAGNDRVLTATLGMELRKAPGTARVELTGLRAASHSIFDGTEQTNSGVSASFTGKLWKQRLLWDAGVADSVSDEGPRAAEYGKLTLQLLQDAPLTKRIKTSWSATFREERVDPGYRSVAAFVVPDRDQKHLDLNGNVGALQFSLAYEQSIDNLAHTDFQWQTHIHQASFSADLPLRDFLGAKKDEKLWVPHITYSYFGLRRFSTEPPRGETAEEAGTLPDDHTVSHAVGVEWGKRLRFGYQFSFDGQSDYGHVLHAATYAWSVAKKLDLTGDIGMEESTQSGVRNRAERFSGRVKWKPDPRLTLSMSFAGTRSHDTASGSALQSSLDVQAQWNLLKENVEKGRRVRADWTARYSNRYQFSASQGESSLYRTQYFQTGLTFTFL